MEPLVLIAFTGFGDTEVEEQVLKQIGAKVEYAGTIMTPEAQELAKRADAIAVTVEPYTPELISTFSNCKIISRFGTGLDNIDIQAATEHGIWVTNVPDAFVEEVSTHVIALLLACNRHLVPLIMSCRQGKWEFTSRPIARLRGQTLGLMGLGYIGQAAARKAQGIGLEVIAHDPYVSADVFETLGIKQVGWEELLKSSDYLSLHVPATDETIQIINAEALALIKPNAYLINTSRGSLIDEEALLEAVQNGQILGAALDVRATEPPPPDDPLIREERIIITPHLAWCSTEAGVDLRVRASQAIVDVLKGKRPRHPANKPKMR